jgi:hypothetical protein
MTGKFIYDRESLEMSLSKNDSHSMSDLPGTSPLGHHTNKAKYSFAQAISKLFQRSPYILFDAGGKAQITADLSQII